MITPVASTDAVDHWLNVEGYIQAAVESVDTGFSSEDILTRIQMQDMQLWVVGNYKAAAVTQVQIYPKHKTLLIVALGGTGLAEWFDQLMGELEEYGRAIGCKYVEEFGRDGWQKVGKKRGYKKIYTVMRKTL